MNNEYSAKEIKDELDAIVLRLNVLHSHIGGNLIDGTHPDSILGRLTRLEAMVAILLTKDVLTAGWRTIEPGDHTEYQLAWRESRAQAASAVVQRVATNLQHTLHGSMIAFQEEDDDINGEGKR